MTAEASPWMNGGCERSHATVDRIVNKILEDDPKLSLQKAVDLACFVTFTVALWKVPTLSRIF